MNFKKISLAFVGALAAGALLTACPGDTGTLYAECTSDTSCSTLEMCHPTAKVCVLTCVDTNDCGDEAKTCAAISATNSTKVCQCSTDALCGGFADGLKCDATSNVCTSGQTTTPPTGTLGDACTGTAQSTCDYGQFCDTTCKAAPETTVAACTNFTKQGVTWTPETGTGPVIYSVADIADITGFCTAPQKPYSFRVNAYNANGTFPATRQQLGNFFYVKVNGDKVDAGLNLMKDASYKISNSSKNGEFDLTVCGASDSTQVQVGLYFTNGNEVCHTTR